MCCFCQYFLDQVNILLTSEGFPSEAIVKLWFNCRNSWYQRKCWICGKLLTAPNGAFVCDTELTFWKLGMNKLELNFVLKPFAKEVTALKQVGQKDSSRIFAETLQVTGTCFLHISFPSLHCRLKCVSLHLLSRFDTKPIIAKFSMLITQLYGICIFRRCIFKNIPELVYSLVPWLFP